MRAVLHRTHGGIDALEIAELPDPVAGPRDVVVRVDATSLNRLDVVQRAGYFTLPGFALPHIAGMDVAGTVESVGSEVDEVAPGDRVVVDPSMVGVPEASAYAGLGDRYGALGVIGGTLPGGYAELCLVPATHVFAVPDDMSAVTASTFPTAWLTAGHALFDVADLQPGETLLVHAAGAGVSVAAIQMAKDLGVTVLATAGSEDKLARATELGADHVADNRQVDVAAWARDVTDGAGVDVVFDHVGTALFGPSLFALGIGGRLVNCGNTSGDEATIPSLGYLFHSRISILGSDPYRPEEFGPLWERFCAGGFDTPVSDVLPLDAAAEAQRRLEGNDVFGKLVLEP
ncbi:MAG: zinc-binding dehydrogenase [Acidimicrobiales bacterium]